MSDSVVNQTQQAQQKPAKAGKRRVFSGPMARLITILAVTLAAFQLYTAFFGVLPSMQQRSFHVAFVLPMIFLLYPAKKNSPRDHATAVDWIFAILAAVCALYTFFGYESIAGRAGVVYPYELWLGALFIILVFIAGQRVLGWPLPIFCFLFLLFAYFGRSMPGPIQHFGLSIPRIIEELYLTTDGLFGLVTGVSATYIYLFVLFGAFLNATKAAEFFNDFSMALTGSMKGGPAKISVISSALVGTISGSTSANVATTGTFTIPLMKSIGYAPHFAGAVEASASTGGQIMPPVMGAAAFIIADSLNVPYTKVLLCAIVPAILYFWGIWCALSLEASKQGLKGLPRESLPKVGKVIVNSGYKVIPLFVIIYLLVKGYNPLYSGCWGIVACVLLSFVKKSDRLNVKTFIDTLEDGSKGALSVAMACIIVGVVIGMMGATGVALRVGDAVLGLTAGHLVPTMLMTLVISILLGMGMPTTASYVMASAVAVPALVLLKVKPLDAHMFVFFYAVLSSVTPPVCVGAYTAAGIANADPNRTAFTACKLALPGFIVPFIFVLAPEILLTNVTNWFVTIQAMITAVVGVFALSVATESYFMSKLHWYESLLAFVAAIGLLYPGTLTDLAGAAILVLLYFVSKRRAVETVEPGTGTTPTVEELKKIMAAGKEGVSDLDDSDVQLEAVASARNNISVKTGKAQKSPLSREKKTIIAAIAAAVVIVLGMMWYANSAVAPLNTQIGSLQTSIGSIEKSLAGLNKSLASTNEVLGKLEKGEADTVARGQAGDKLDRVQYEMYKGEIEQLKKMVDDLGRILGDSAAIPTPSSAKSAVKK